MGHPRKQRSGYSRPKRPYDKSRIDSEKKVMRSFGLRRKKEIRRAESILRNFRRRARDLLTLHDKEKEKMLFDKLFKMGLVNERKLEDVLEIKLEHILSRRLQTLVHKKGLAKTIKSSRHTIVHGHIAVNERKTKWPGAYIDTDLENKIELINRPKSAVKKEIKISRKGISPSEHPENADRKPDEQEVAHGDDKK